MAVTKLRPGMKLELVAAEPLIADPVAIDWDRDGSLWVAEMADYPYGMDNQGKPGGRIRRLRDSDGDGQYDQSELFLDGLSFPTGVMAWRDGVLVTAAPELFFARDRDGDGRADERTVLFRGFVEGNQQLRVNGLRYGLENMIHCAAGGHHAGFGADNSITVVTSGETLALGSRDFRFDPDTGTIVPESGPSQFGRVRDDWNHWYGVQNSFPLWHYVLEDRYLRRNPRGQFPDARQQLRTPANPPVLAISQPQQRYHSFEHAGHYTSACGPCIYRDSLLFADQPGTTHAFTCEPFHNVVQHHELRASGVTFTGQRAEEEADEHDFFASADPWSRPVMARTGPDGALWVVDMYRYMIEHPEWLPPEGQEDFKQYYRSGDDRGRIYRIVPSDRASIPRPQPLPTEPAELVKLLESSNGWVRDRAQQEIIARQLQEVLPPLMDMVRTHPDPKTRLHSLYTAAALLREEQRDSGETSDSPDNVTLQMPALLLATLNDPRPELRRHALRLAERLATRNDALQRAVCSMVEDDDPKVRLQLALSLGEIPSPAASDALLSLCSDPSSDRFMTAALVSSAPAHRTALLAALHDPGHAIHPDVRRAVFGMAHDDAQSLAQLLDALIPDDPSSAETSQLRRCVEWLESLESHGRSVPSLREQYPALGSQFAALDGLWHAAWPIVADSSLPAERRGVGLALLRHAIPPTADQQAILLELLRPTSSSELQHAAVTVLLRDDSPQTSMAVLDVWTRIAPSVRSVVVDQLIARPAGAGELLARIEAADIAPLELSASQRDRLLHHRDPTLAERSRAVLRLADNADRAEVVQRYRSAAQLKADTNRGQPLFQKHCASCHLSQEGSPIGPQLHALSDRSPHSLLVAILDPSRAVEPKYLSYQVELKSGQVLYGVIVGESGQTVRVQQQDGVVHELLRDNIEQLHSSRRSFMPDGFEAELTTQDLADLIDYVQRLTAP
jgi:putative membrane-bound dehydrogenase-like protein